MVRDENLVSYCGLFCGACTAYQDGTCKGCRGDGPDCGIGFRACRIKPCCNESGYSTCAECKKQPSAKSCKIFNPLFMRFGCFITNTSRTKGLDMIKEKGTKSFMEYMISKNWVVIKLRER